MKLVRSNGLLAKARRYLSLASSVQEEEVKDPSKLAEVIRQALKRISELEARTPPESIEFEVNVSAGGALVSIAHGIKGPVRWWVTTWTQQDGVAKPANGHSLVQDSTSTTGTLVLRSYVLGRAIVRIEPASFSIDPGITV